MVIVASAAIINLAAKSEKKQQGKTRMVILQDKSVEKKKLEEWRYQAGLVLIVISRDTTEGGARF